MADVLASTTTICPECHRALPGRYVVADVGGAFLLERVCPDHGAFAPVVLSNRRDFVARADAAHPPPASSSSSSPASSSSSSSSAATGPLHRSCIALLEI